MKIWTMSELEKLSRTDLLELFQTISNRLPALAEGTTERQLALKNLENIRLALSRPVFGPRRPGLRGPTP